MALALEGQALDNAVKAFEAALVRKLGEYLGSTAMSLARIATTLVRSSADEGIRARAQAAVGTLNERLAELEATVGGAAVHAIHGVLQGSGAAPGQ